MLRYLLSTLFIFMLSTLSQCMGIDDFQLAKCLRDCKNGDLEKVKEHIEVYGISPNAQLTFVFEHNGSSTLLSMSTFLHGLSSNPDVLRYLIDKGAHINKMDSYGVVPLMVACSELDVDSASVFLSKGSSINFGDMQGTTPFHFVLMSMLEIQRDTQDKKVDRDAKAVQIIRLLRERNADFSLKDGTASTPLHYAAQGTSLDLLLATIAPHDFAEKLKREALARLRCFLLCNNRLKATRQQFLIPVMCKKVISCMAVDCMYSNVRDSIALQHTTACQFDSLYIREIISLLAKSLTGKECALLKAALETFNNEGKLPLDYADKSPSMKAVLSPINW